MALQQIPGQGLWIPEPLIFGNTIQTTLLIDATGEKVAFCGRVWNKDRASKSIRKVGFRFGAITKAGGSALTVSLQDVDLANGPPMRPDETQDQTVAVANADAGFASNGWYQTGAFDADRSVSFGDLVSVVIEYDGAGRLSSDSVTVSGIGYVGGTDSFQQIQSVLKTGGTWASNATIPNVILEFSDGTFGTLLGGLPFSNLTTQSFKQDTAGSDEYALEFQIPFPCKVDGFWIKGNPAANTNNFDMVLYSGTSAMTNGTVSIDANAVNTISSTSVFYSTFPAEIQLTANTTYRLAMKPTQTTGNVAFTYIDVSTANHFQALAGGTSWALTSRLDLGSWAATTTTRRPLMGIHVSSLDDGVSTGGVSNYIE